MSTTAGLGWWSFEPGSETVDMGLWGEISVLYCERPVLYYLL